MAGLWQLALRPDNKEISEPVTAGAAAVVAERARNHAQRTAVVNTASVAARAAGGE